VLGTAQIEDRGEHGLAGHLLDALVDVLAVEDAVALLVDDLALLVHHVVVLEHVLASGEVHRLDLALRALDGLGDEPAWIGMSSGMSVFSMKPRCGPSGLRRTDA
jgi:hypothetical protein